MSQSIPVITIDGSSGTGKGTMMKRLASHLGWHMLDSGALYRLLALAATHHKVSFEDEPALEKLALTLDVRFIAPEQEAQPTKILLEGAVVTDAIRTEAMGEGASKVAALPKVREALLQRQRDFRQAPGLIADGRDMGTVIFPDAKVKFFLDASAEERARRRTAQLEAKGVACDYEQILQDIQKRDDRDRNRVVSPLKPAHNAIVMDSSDLTIQEVYDLMVKNLPQ